MLRWLSSLPLTVKVPALVALLMVVVSIAISERVLSGLAGTQERHLRAVSDTYLDGLSTSLLPGVLREDIWEAFDAVDRASSLYKSVKPIETVVTGLDQRVLAASNPLTAPTLRPLDAEFQARFVPNGLIVDAGRSQALVRRTLVYQNRPLAEVYAAFDASDLIAERREVLHTLVLGNAILTAIFAAIGYLAVRRMIRPVQVLSRHLQRGLEGPAEPISEKDFPARTSEFARLFDGYNALVRAERERSTLAYQLAEEERLASLGRLASGMAHEINNPLGGIFNAIDTLKRHGNTPGVRATAIHLVERGLMGIRDVVRAALATYRTNGDTRPLSTADLEDVRLLIAPELRRRGQRLAWSIDQEWIALAEVPGPLIRQAVLNLLLNASAVVGDGGGLRLSVRRRGDGRLAVEVADSGPGLPDYARAILSGSEPGLALHSGRGLGLWMVRRIVDEVGGEIELGTSSEGGASISLVLGTRRDGALRDVA